MHKLRTLHLFAGAGGGILGDVLLGHQCVCAVEINNYCQQVLAARQKDGMLPWFPIFDDVKSFDGTQWRGLVDVVAGGFPCQDISISGRGDGLDGERSGLWSEMARIIGEVRPRFAFMENSPMLTSRGLGRVLGDLATLGFNAEWGVVGADELGAFHKRDRIWIVAHANSQRVRCEGYSSTDGAAPEAGGQVWQQWVRLNAESGRQDVADARGYDEQRKFAGSIDAQVGTITGERPTRPRRHGFGRWPVEPELGRVVNGLAHRVDRIRVLGNGQVSRVACAAFDLLSRG